MNYLGKSINCYVGIVAQTEAEARSIGTAQFHSAPLDLVHIELPEEPEEQPTWIFTFWADSYGDVGDGDMLHDHYDLPFLPNLPYEVA